MEVWAIVVAAGAGTRFGGDKQRARLGSRAVLDWSIEVAAAVCDGVVVALADPAVGSVPPPARTVLGGRTRSESVRAGLGAVPESADVIVVHDGARPLATVALWRSVIAALRDGADGAVPGLPVRETLKRVADGRIVETVPRADLVAVQTPQAFRAASLRRAHDSGADDTDDAALVEATGGVVLVTEGEPRNLKVTVPEDLDLARLLVGAP